MELFDAKERSDRRKSGRSEGNWQFLDRVAGPYWDQVRSLLNDWFANLGDEAAKKSVRGRVRSGDETDFRGAMAELYVHESLLRDGYAVTYEPEIAGSSRRPDFLATRGDLSMYVEVTSRTTSEPDPSGAKREAALYDAIDSMSTDNFMLTFDVEARGPSAIAARPIKMRLRKWLESLDPDEVIESMNGNRFGAMPEISMRQAGWEIDFRAIPVAKELRGLSSERTAIGMSGGPGRIVNDREIIRSALSDKTHAYGPLTRPYVIALALDSFGHDEEIESALYGGRVVHARFDGDSLVESRVERDALGYWTGERSPGRSRVSGLLIVPNPLPYGLSRAVPSLWIHPNPDLLAPLLPLWRTVALDGGALIVTEPASAPWVFFGIPERWPVGSPFGRWP